MSPDSAIEMIREALMLSMLIALPLLAIGLVVGLVVSLVQAVTQLQEQTLVFVPKILAMVGAAVVLMPWIVTQMIDYSRELFLFMSP